MKKIVAYILVTLTLALNSGLVATVPTMATGTETTTTTTSTITSTTWYVNSSYSGDEYGTESQPYNTIQEAVNGASSGDTIIVEDGTYSENVDVYKSLTIKSENGATSTMVTAAHSDDHTFYVYADNVTIDGFTITGATDYGKSGIYLYTSNYCNIYDNTCGYDASNKNYAGIFISLSSNNNIEGNTCNSNIDSGILLMELSENNTVINNTCSNNVMGIYLWHSSENTISGSTCSDNNCAIFLGISNNTTVTGNTCLENSYGMEIVNSNNNTITGNNSCSNNYEGIYLSTSNNNTINENTCSSNSAEGIDLTDSNYNTIDSNICLNNFQGIALNNNSDNNTVTDNDCSNNSFGIWLYNSIDNMLTDNICSANSAIGIFFGESPDNELRGNTCNENAFYGIALLISSINNTITDNIISNNDYGIYIDADTDASTISIYYNNIEGNTSYGICNDNADTLDATYNWWGSYTGPTNPSNPDGTGDIISDRVDFDPWLGYTTHITLFGEEISYIIDKNGEMLQKMEATNGILTVNIPKGTILLDKDGNPFGSLSISDDNDPADPPDDASIILAYSFLTGGATFDPAIILTFTYNDADIPDGVAEKDLFIAYYNGSEWVKLACIVDTENNVLTAYVTHFTSFALIAQETPVTTETVTMTQPATTTISTITMTTTRTEESTLTATKSATVTSTQLSIVTEIQQVTSTQSSIITETQQVTSTETPVVITKTQSAIMTTTQSTTIINILPQTTTLTATTTKTVIEETTDWIIMILIALGGIILGSLTVFLSGRKSV
jgi:nitrous oxidase accessory protein